MSIVERAREWFLLSDLQARAARVEPAVRAKAARTLALSEQRRRAAEVAWTGGVPAEALRLAHEAVQLAAEGAGVGRGETPLPTFDEDVTSADTELYQGLLDEQARLLLAHEELRLDVAQVRERRLARWLTSGIVAAAFIGAAGFFLRTPPRLEATASARFDPRFEPANAVDGNEKTDWLLPDRASGTLDVKVIPARTLKLVRVMNARNLPFADRATHDLLIEALDHGKVVKSGAFAFEGQSADAAWRSLDLGVKVDAVRVTVKSWHGLGGGLAEVVVE